MSLKFMKAWQIMVILLYLLVCIVWATEKGGSLKEQISNTGLLGDHDSETLFVSTLDGALHSISKLTGTRKWTLSDEPVISNPTNDDQSSLPRFFPNPHDGSLYRYTVGPNREPLKKLPFTIPELVANSPCRSNDGIFYLGKKVDSWVGVDSITGKKQLVLGVDSVEHICPKPSRHTIYLGRTQYNIILFEPNSGSKWNVSFYHYTTNAASSKVDNYDLVHYTSAGEGTLLTLDQKSGATLWTHEFQSPVVAIYLLSPEGTLASVPLTTVAPRTLETFTYDLLHLNSKENSEAILVKKLSPTIYLGESKGGIYAIPSLVDENTITIRQKEDQMLLEGPPGKKATMQVGENKEPYEEKDLILLGYYDLPDNLSSQLEKLSHREVQGFTDQIPLGITHKKVTDDVNPIKKDVETQTDPKNQTFKDGWKQLTNLNGSFLTSGDAISWVGQLSRGGFIWLLSDPLNFLVFILTAGVFLIIVILYKQAQEYARLSREVSSHRLGSRGSSNGNSDSGVTSIIEETEEGNIRVGKVCFDPREILGKGCDGTFVYKGWFDGRCVAVKRVLPSCFSIADREVELLRASDQHPNVVRYFCMEQCREFRYIALELCAATLEDLILGRFTTNVPFVVFLKEATEGLHHLHLLEIVHRDIKPHNVLLSLPDHKSRTRAVISDFGLCKKLETGKRSFSMRSGLTGTEGWIAPEMLNTDRPTTKVDIFSLGCVYYYVLTKGRHPFGYVLDRQSRIISGSFDLDDLDRETNCLSYSLIESMISPNPSERPPTSSLIVHPLFWSSSKVLQFFGDVSDRVEKEAPNSPVMVSLEWGSSNVIKNGWHNQMHPAVAEDLRKFRDYNSRSVRALLRALRNKKSHYRDLSEEVQRVFGSIPDGFVFYWTSRFPRLLLHTWYAMQGIKSEDLFNKYYCSAFNFKKGNLHAMVSLSPNNVQASSQDSFDNYSSFLRPDKSPRTLKHLKSHESSLLDSVLGPIRKGAKHHRKLDYGNVTPTWSNIRYAKNTFDPVFKPHDSILRQQDDPPVSPQDNELQQSILEESSENVAKFGNLGNQEVDGLGIDIKTIDEIYKDDVNSDLARLNANEVEMENSCVRIVPKNTLIDGSSPGLKEDKMSSYASMCKGDVRQRHRESRLGIKQMRDINEQEADG